MQIKISRQGERGGREKVNKKNEEVGGNERGRVRQKDGTLELESEEGRVVVVKKAKRQRRARKREGKRDTRRERKREKRQEEEKNMK